MDWLYFKTPRITIPVDKQEIYFGRYGEFSADADTGFEKHIQRLNKLNNSPAFKNLNGKRLKKIYSTEPLKYWRV